MLTPVKSTSSLPRNDFVSVSRAQSTPNNMPKYNSLLEMQTEFTRPTTAGIHMHAANATKIKTNVHTSQNSICNSNIISNANTNNVNGGSVNKEGKSNIFVAVRVRPLHVHHSRECNDINTNITTTETANQAKNKKYVSNKEISNRNVAKPSSKSLPEMNNYTRHNEDSISNTKTNVVNKPLNNQVKSENINSRVNEQMGNNNNNKSNRSLPTSPSPQSSILSVPLQPPHSTTSTSSNTANVSESSLESSSSSTCPSQSSYERCVHILANNVIECNLPTHEDTNAIYNGELYAKNNMANNTITPNIIPNANANSSNSGRFASACDVVFDEHTSQEEIMHTVGFPAVNRVMEGYNGTILCYGQSGSGKTYTMIGPEGGDERALRVYHRHCAMQECENINNSSSRDHITPMHQKQELFAKNKCKKDKGNTLQERVLEQELAASTHITQMQNDKNNYITNSNNDNDSEKVDDTNLEYSIPADTGLLTRILLRLLNQLHHDEQAGRNKAWSLTLSVVELYNEQLRDLLPEETVCTALAKYERERAQVEREHKMSPLRNDDQNVNKYTQSVSRQASVYKNVPYANKLYLTESEQESSELWQEEQEEEHKEYKRMTSNYNDSDMNDRELSPEPANDNLNHNNSKLGNDCEPNDQAVSEVYSADDSGLEVSLSTLGNTERMMMMTNTNTNTNTTTTATSSDYAISPLTTTPTTNTIVSNGTITVNMSAPSSCDIQENTYDDHHTNWKEPSPSSSPMIAKDKASCRSMSVDNKNKDFTNNNNIMSNLGNDNKNKMMKNGKSTRSQSIHSLPLTRLPLAATNNITTNKNDNTNYNKLKSSNRSNLPWNQRGKLNKRNGKRIASTSPSPSSGQRGASRANSTASFATTNTTSTSAHGKELFKTNNQNSNNNIINTSVPKCNNLFIRTRPSDGTAPTINNNNTKSKEQQMKSNSFVSNTNSSSVFVQGLGKHLVHNIDEALDLMHVALHERHMGVTQLNVNSNRAHTLFFVEVEQVIKEHAELQPTVNDHKDHHNVQDKLNNITGTSDIFYNTDNKNINDDSTMPKFHRKDTPTSVPMSSKLTLTKVKKSLLTLVDLAGSERVSHTGAEGIRLKEAQKINCSLMLLANVIRRLNTINKNISSTHSSVHIPYRDSKLTWLLRDSFGGNTITFVLCNISAHVRNARETISTLRFATSMKLVFNILVINTEQVHLSSRAIAALQRRLQEAQDYIQRLEAQIKTQDEEGNTPQSIEMIYSHEQESKFSRKIENAAITKTDKECQMQSVGSTESDHSNKNEKSQTKSEELERQQEEVDHNNDHSRSMSDHLQEELESVKEAHMQTAHELQSMKEKMASLMNSLAARERELNELKSKSSDNSARTSHSNTPPLVQLCKANNSYSASHSHSLPPCPSSASQSPLMLTSSSPLTTDRAVDGRGEKVVVVNDGRRKEGITTTTMNTNTSMMSPSSSLVSFTSPQLSSTASLLPSTSESNFTRRYSRHVIPIIYRRPSFISVRSTNVSEQNSSANSCMSGYKYVPVFAPVHSRQGTAEQNELAYQQLHKNNMVKLDQFSNNKSEMSSNTVSNKNAISSNMNCASGVNNTIIIKANEDAIVQYNNTHTNNNNNNIKNKNNIDDDDDPTKDVINAEEPHMQKTDELCNESTPTSGESTSNEDGIQNNFEEVKMLSVRSNDNDARSRLWQR